MTPETISYALGELVAKLGLCLIVVFVVTFCIASMAGAYRGTYRISKKKVEPVREDAHRARGRALRRVARVWARPQKEAKPWSL